MKVDATHLDSSSPTRAGTQAASKTKDPATHLVTDQHHITDIKSGDGSVESLQHGNDQHARQQQADKGTSNKNSLSPSRDQGHSQPDSLNPESSKLPTENASKKSGDHL